jgi:hypothetical protein
MQLMVKLLQVFLTISILMGEGMYMVLRVLVSCESFCTASTAVASNKKCDICVL